MRTREEQWMLEAVAPFQAECRALAYDISRGWPIRRSRRMVRAIGRASINWNHQDGRVVRASITLSMVHWETMTEDQRKTTVCHEVCHIVAIMLHGLKASGHGPLWAACMARLGLSPDRTAGPNTGNLEALQQMHKARRPHAYKCGCMDLKYLTTNMHNKIKRGALYRCRSCGGILRKT